MTFLRFSARQGLNASRIAKTLKYATIGETPSLTDPRWYWWWVLHDHREQFHRVQAEPEIHEKRAVIQQSAATETGEEGGESSATKVRSLSRFFTMVHTCADPASGSAAVPRSFRTSRASVCRGGSGGPAKHPIANQIGHNYTQNSSRMLAKREPNLPPTLHIPNANLKKGTVPYRKHQSVTPAAHPSAA